MRGFYVNSGATNEMKYNYFDFLETWIISVQFDRVMHIMKLEYFFKLLFLREKLLS